nr:hypothetical protein CFP56_26045 [Quercus suber]
MRCLDVVLDNNAMSGLHRVLADSDDENDGEAIYVESSDSSRSVLNAPPMAMLDGTDERSTGSTELLRKEICDAELGLFATSGSGGNATVIDEDKASLPASSRLKRRHSEIYQDAQIESTGTGIKRLKTLPAYSNPESTTIDFDRPPSPSIPLNSSAIEPNVNQVTDLPDGTLRTAFVDHDPEMFKDTGSTIPDNSSSQRRTIEQARHRLEVAGALTAGSTIQTDERSSSFPWPSSRGTKRILDERAEQSDFRRATSQASLTHMKQGDDDTDSVYGVDLNNCVEVTSEKNDQRPQHSHLENREKKQPSPRVEISPPRSSERNVISVNVSATQRSTKGRRCKTQKDDSDPLCWDESTIGLPKERYVPRLSNRRSKSHLIEVIDFSIAPEKAAKAARAKSMAAARNINASLYDELQGRVAGPADTCGSAPRASSTAPRKSTVTNKTNGLTGDSTELNRESTSNQLPASGTSTDSLDHSDQGPASTFAQSSPTTKRQHDDTSPQKLKLEPCHGKANVKIRAKASRLTKARRSHTTIFEDHVDFTGCDVSPNLIQQQANRKSALRAAHNGTPASKGRKRRTVVQDDEEDDEELANSVLERAESTRSENKVQDKFSSRRPRVASDSDENMPEKHDDVEEPSDADCTTTSSAMQVPEKAAARSKKGSAAPEETEPAVAKEVPFETYASQTGKTTMDPAAPGRTDIAEQFGATSPAQSQSLGTFPDQKLLGRSFASGLEQALENSAAATDPETPEKMRHMNINVAVTAVFGGDHDPVHLWCAWCGKGCVFCFRFWIGAEFLPGTGVLITMLSTCCHERKHVARVYEA